MVAPVSITNLISTTSPKDLMKYDNYPDVIVPNKTSMLHFRRHLRKLKNSSLFVDKRVRSTYLGKEILNIKSGDVFVIDIAKISSRFIQHLGMPLKYSFHTLLLRSLNIF
jgi:hypothetical protein